MTTRQQQAFDYIKAHQRTITVGPTLRDLAKHLGVFVNAAQGHVAALKTSGEVQVSRDRGITLKDPVADFLKKHAADAKTELRSAMDSIAIAALPPAPSPRQPIPKPNGKL